MQATVLGHVQQAHIVRSADYLIMPELDRRCSARHVHHCSCEAYKLHILLLADHGIPPGENMPLSPDRHAGSDIHYANFAKCACSPHTALNNTRNDGQLQRLLVPEVDVQCEARGVEAHEQRERRDEQDAGDRPEEDLGVLQEGQRAVA